MLFAEAYSAGIVLVLRDAHEHGGKAGRQEGNQTGTRVHVTCVRNGYSVKSNVTRRVSVSHKKKNKQKTRLWYCTDCLKLIASSPAGFLGRPARTQLSSETDVINTAFAVYAMNQASTPSIPLPPSAFLSFSPLSRRATPDGDDMSGAIYPSNGPPWIPPVASIA